MTREETVKIVRMAYSNNPNIKVPNNISDIVDSWSYTLKEFDYNDIAMALVAYNRTDMSGFLPTPAKLISMLQKITKPQELSEMEAWSLVKKAISNSAYDYVEEFHKLPPIIQKCVGSAYQLKCWALDEDFNEQVASSNFARSYRVMVARQEEYMKMPQEIREVISTVSKNLYLPQNDAEDVKMIDTSHEKEKLKIEALDERRECVPMPSNIKKRLEEFRNEQGKKATD